MSFSKAKREQQWFRFRKMSHKFSRKLQKIERKSFYLHDGMCFHLFAPYSNYNNLFESWLSSEWTKSVTKVEAELTESSSSGTSSLPASVAIRTFLLPELSLPIDLRFAFKKSAAFATIFEGLLEPNGDEDRELTADVSGEFGAVKDRELHTDDDASFNFFNIGFDDFFRLGSSSGGCTSINCSD